MQLLLLQQYRGHVSYEQMCPRGHGCAGVTVSLLSTRRTTGTPLTALTPHAWKHAQERAMSCALRV